MKLIYVAHPYGGKKENEVEADVVTRMLQKRFPEHCFVSPIHAIREAYNEKTTEDEYITGMKHCIALLSRCDAIVFTGDWRHSRGCLIENLVAQNMGIGIMELDYIVAMDNITLHCFLNDSLNDREVLFRKK